MIVWIVYFDKKQFALSVNNPHNDLFGAKFVRLRFFPANEIDTNMPELCGRG